MNSIEIRRCLICHSAIWLLIYGAIAALLLQDPHAMRPLGAGIALTYLCAWLQQRTAR